MYFRSAGIIATLLIGLEGSGCHAFAQYYPSQLYPPPQAYAVPPGPPYRALPPIGADDDPRDAAALPSEIRPETGPKKELPPQFLRTLVDYYTKEPAGTIIIDTQNTYLFLVLGNGKALRYGIGVGREGFIWSGAEKISRMAEWPDWNPPEQMIERQPYLPEQFMAGGDGNPLGARALYLGRHALPHPRHQSAVHHRQLRVLGLHPAHQRGHHRSLRAGEGWHPRGGAVRQGARECGGAGHFAPTRVDGGAE